MPAQPQEHEFFAELPIDTDLQNQSVESLFEEESEIKARAERVRRLIRMNRAFVPVRNNLHKKQTQ